MKSLILILLVSSLSHAALPAGSRVEILDYATTTTATGEAHRPNGAKRSFQCAGDTTAGAGASDIVIEVSNNGLDWVTAGTITLTLSTTQSDDGFTMDSPWYWVRARVSAISGTGAAVGCTMGTE